MKITTKFEYKMSNIRSGVGIYIDIIDSRKIETKYDLELRINNLKKFFNRNVEYGIFDIWKGLDEYMIISPNWEFAVKSVIKVQELLHPYEQRFVLTGFEDVDTNIPVHEMSNKEFITLSDGMVNLKKNRLYADVIPAGHTLLLDSVSIILNALISLKRSFTGSQMDIYCHYKVGKSQFEIALQTNTSQQYVSKTLNGIKADNLNTLEQKLYKVIAYGIDKGNSGS